MLSQTVRQIPARCTVQAALYDISSCRTVPQVFIGGEFVGGADGGL
jgi:glutaredoxin-related protein